MAYPAENEHIEYLRYKEKVEIEEGGTALPKEEWRKTRTPTQKNTQPQTPKPTQSNPESRNAVIRAIMMMR
jgi:hypothetical protein